MTKRQDYRNRHMKLGLCADCSNPAKGGILVCEKHRAERNEWSRKNMKKFRQRYMDSRRCKRCSRPLSEDEGGYCSYCSHNSEYRI